MNTEQKPVLIIMAAGMGSRYGGLKQVDKITDAGEIILDFFTLRCDDGRLRQSYICHKGRKQGDFQRTCG
mgnify:CR=1 FL=1